MKARLASFDCERCGKHVLVPPATILVCAGCLEYHFPKGGMSVNNQIIELGDRIKDPISKFEGICVGITSWLYGCERVCISPEKRKDDGTIIEDVWIDRARAEVVEKAAVNPIQFMQVPRKDDQRSDAGSGGPAREQGRGFNPG